MAKRTRTLHIRASTHSPRERAVLIRAGLRLARIEQELSGNSLLSVRPRYHFEKHASHAPLGNSFLKADLREIEGILESLPESDEKTGLDEVLERIQDRVFMIVRERAVSTP